MTLRKKLAEAMVKATEMERDRVMRILHRLVNKTQDQLNKKLMTASDKHIAETKMKMVSAIVASIQISVMSGEDPDGGEEKTNGDQAPEAG